jgi:hypothetical protein
VKNREVLKRVRRKGTSYLQENEEKTNWIGHVLGTNCLLSHIADGKKEGMMEVTGTCRKHMLLLDDLKGDRNMQKKTYTATG